MAQRKRLKEVLIKKGLTAEQAEQKIRFIETLIGKTWNECENKVKELKKYE